MWKNMGPYSNLFVLISPKVEQEIFIGSTGSTAVHIDKKVGVVWADLPTKVSHLLLVSLIGHKKHVVHVK